MNRCIILGFVLLLLTAGVTGQVFRSFSTDTTSYPDELKTFMGLGLIDSDSLVNDFVKRWKNEEYTDEEKVEIISLSNLMLKKNARPKPHFQTFLICLELFSTSEQVQESYTKWKLGLRDIAGSDKYRLSEVENFMSFTVDLLETGTIYRSASVQWHSASDNFRFEFQDSVILVLENTDLTCYAIRDSLKIFGTSGVYLPLRMQWIGKEGTVNWENSGFPPDRVYALLSSYSVNFRLSEYQADSVRFFNKNYFDFGIEGDLFNKVERVASIDNANFPRFNSYNANFKLKQIFPNIDFEGGISMYGSKLVGSGNKINKAHLNFYMSDTLVIVAGSEYFIFTQDQISGVNTEISLYTGYDSIYHPSIGMNYFVDENRISLYRTSQFQSQSPYYNSYQRVEMNFEQLSWQLDDDIILLKSSEGASSGIANFQSDNLFHAETYFRLQGIDDENPLVSLRRFSEKEMDISFLGYDFARFTRTAHTQMQQILKRLAELGFIIYDLEDDRVTLRQKLYDWIYASVNFIDYDVMDLVSETESPMVNAILDLNTNDITIYGIPVIRLSSAQNVIIFPRNEQIVLKRNRNFQFNGTVNAGLFTFHGNNFFFDYDDFKINMQDIDSLNLQVRSDQAQIRNQTSFLDIQNIIQNMTGELLIDKPDNKSGRTNYPVYPVFTSNENSFVYYDQPYIQDSVYKRDNFYFEVYPFAFDSLDNFTRLGMSLEGKFHSADIFPDFEQILEIQPDNSLGFTFVTEETGLPLYGGKGHFYEHVQMDNSGLRGSGEFEFLTVSGRSGDFLFHPDSMMAKLEKFELESQASGVQYPMVRSSQNEIKWFPFKDELLVQEGERPFTILNDSTSMGGTLTLTPQGLTGAGRMELTNSVLTSERFTYTAYSFAADTADFRLKSVNTDGFTLVTDNVNASVDFESRSGLFKTNEESTLVRFPENKYISRLNLFIWDMDEELLEMGEASLKDSEPVVIVSENGEDELIGPRYISTDPLQDSLYFVSTRAFYDYRNNIIRASHVNFIKVADAYIFPKDGEVVIEADGTMKKIEESSILANRTGRLHNFYNAGIQVLGRNKYTAGAYYDYIAETGVPQVILFDNIYVDDSVRTVAEGMIPDLIDFTLSPYYGFQGKAILRADKKFLTFNGGAKIFHDCENIALNYLKFNAEINPMEIYIPVEEQSYDINMNYIYSGIFMANDSVHTYPAFFSRKKLPRDKYIVTAEGYLFYDKETEEYRISSREKLEDLNQPGNYIKLSGAECVEYGEGKTNLGVLLGQTRLSSVGKVVKNVKEDETEITVSLAMNFFMSDEAFAIMTDELIANQNLKAFDLTDKDYQKNIAELVGSRKASALQAELGLYGAYQTKVPELTHTLFFARVKFSWNQDSRSWKSVGPIGLGSINGSVINRNIEGQMQFSKRNSGDLFDLMLQLDDQHWYYFGYTRGVMHVLSSNRDFNGTINAMKTKDRKMKTPKNQIPYIFTVTTAEKRSQFLRTFQEEIP